MYPIGGGNDLEVERELNTVSGKNMNSRDLKYSRKSRLSQGRTVMSKCGGGGKMKKRTEKREIEISL